jgi:hypothetical protein
MFIFLASALEPVRCDCGLTVIPSDTPQSLPDPDLIVVPAAVILPVLSDHVLIDWLRAAPAQDFMPPQGCWLARRRRPIGPFVTTSVPWASSDQRSRNEVGGARSRAFVEHAVPTPSMPAPSEAV